MPSKRRRQLSVAKPIASQSAAVTEILAKSKGAIGNIFGGTTTSASIGNVASDKPSQPKKGKRERKNKPAAASAGSYCQLKRSAPTTFEEDVCQTSSKKVRYTSDGLRIYSSEELNLNGTFRQRFVNVYTTSVGRL